MSDEDIFERLGGQISSMSKGQFLSILVIVTLLFISGGSMFTSLFAKNQLNYVWSVYTGDARHMAEAHTKAQVYPSTLSQNVEYSINNAALELGKNGSHREWEKSNIPTHESLIQQYNGTIVSHPDYGIRENNWDFRCNVPSIQSYSIVEDRTYGTTEGNPHFAYSMGRDTMRCAGGRFETTSIEGIEWLYTGYGGYDQDERIPNNFVETSGYAVNLTEEMQNTMPSTPIYAAANETTDDCDPNSDDRQEAREQSRSSSISDATDLIEQVVDDAVDNTDTPSYIGVDHSESASFYVSDVDDPDNVYDVPCDLRHSHLNTSCETEDCDVDLNPDGSVDGHGHGISYRGGGTDCSLAPLFVGQATDCVSHVHPTEQEPNVLVKKKYEFNTTLATYYASVNLTDEDNTVVTYNGSSTNIPYNYDYEHPLDN